jgi:VanZ family protein
MLKNILKTPWPSILWTGLIFFLLTINTGSIESAPRIPVPHLDKGVHTFLFAILTYLLVHWRTTSRFSGTSLLLIVGLSAGYGTAMEFYQDYFTTREFEIGDILADSLGAALPALWFWIKKSPYGNRGRNQN